MARNVQEGSEGGFRQEKEGVSQRGEWEARGRGASAEGARAGGNGHEREVLQATGGNKGSAGSAVMRCAVRKNDAGGGLRTRQRQGGMLRTPCIHRLLAAAWCAPPGRRCSEEGPYSAAQRPSKAPIIRWTTCRGQRRATGAGAATGSMRTAWRCLPRGARPHACSAAALACNAHAAQLLAPPNLFTSLQGSPARRTPWAPACVPIINQNK